MTCFPPKSLIHICLIVNEIKTIRKETKVEVLYVINL